MVYQVRFVEGKRFHVIYATAFSQRLELVRDLLPRRRICKKIRYQLQHHDLLNDILLHYSSVIVDECIYYIYISVFCLSQCYKNSYIY